MTITSAQLVQAVQGLQSIGAEFYSRGWSRGTSSNYSIILSREPIELLVTASGKDKGNLGSDDFVRIDRHGNPSFAGQPKSSAETLIHVVLAQLPQVGAILHTHSVWGTLLSQLYFQAGGFAISDYEMLKGLEGVTTHEHHEWVRIFDNTQDMTILSNQVARALHDEPQSLGHGFLIRQHGLYTWGCDLFAARRHVEIYEFLFECLVRQRSLTLTS